jgi:hypothetical protein
MSSRALFSVVLLSVFFVCATGLIAQPPDKVKGQLPANWGKLGLSDEQKQKVYKIQADYRKKIDALEAEIEQMKKKQLEEMTGVLSPDQKKKLAAIIKGSIPEDKKP